MKIPPASVKKARTIATYGRVPIICLVRQVDAGPRRQATVMVSHNALWGHWGGTNGDEGNNFLMRRHFHVFLQGFSATIFTTIAEWVMRVAMTSRSTDHHHMRYKDGKASETVRYEQRGYIGFRYDAPNLARDTKRDALLVLLNIDAILKASTFKPSGPQLMGVVSEQPSPARATSPCYRHQHDGGSDRIRLTVVRSVQMFGGS